jgi:hypothetical protein
VARFVAVMAATLASSLISATVAQAQEQGAMALLEAMTDYIAEQQTIELTFDSALEVVTPELRRSCSPTRARCC